jgi:TfoX/Sxy family transcriptional regulator of competence genes
MPYDEKLAARIRSFVKGQDAVVEKKMFGGLAYLSNGKMFAGILKEDLVVRVGPDGHADALKQPHTRPMDFTGKPMKGYVSVGPAGTKDAAHLRKWLAKGLDFAATLTASTRKAAHRGRRG